MKSQNQEESRLKKDIIRKRKADSIRQKNTYYTQTNRKYQTCRQYQTKKLKCLAQILVETDTIRHRHEDNLARPKRPDPGPESDAKA